MLNVNFEKVLSNISRAKLHNLLYTNEFEFSAPRHIVQYSPAGKCNVLDIVVHKNVRLSEVNV
jgi:hypothetical protein